MMNLFLFSLISLFFLFSLVCAQVQFKGKFDSKARQVYFGKRTDSRFDTESKYKIQVPFHDSNLLLKSDELEKNTIRFSPIKVAKAIPIEIDSRINGIWEEDTNAKIKTWSLFIESKTALGIALIFDNFHIFGEGEMYIINESGILGAFTKRNNKADGKFSIQSLRGSKIFIIYIESLKSVKPLTYFKIGKVVHTYRDIFIGKSTSGVCNVDSKCVDSFVRF